MAGYTLRGDSGSGPASGAAVSASSLDALIVKELQAHYYKPVDAARLERTGVTATLASLHDPYTVYLTPAQSQALTESLSGSYSGIGAEFDKRGAKLVVTGVFSGSPAKAAGLAAGDWIVAVDGVAVGGQSADAAAARIKGVEGTRVTLSVRTAGKGKAHAVTLTRRQHRRSRDEQQAHPQAAATRSATSTCRASPPASGRPWAATSPRCAPRAPAPSCSTCATTRAATSPRPAACRATFSRAASWSPRTGCTSPPTSTGRRGRPATRQPLVVLVNHWSASASEITAGALQDHHRATIIGTRTYGKAVAQTNFALPGGATLHMTIAGYLTPNGRDINHKGITPSVTVVDNAKTPRDEALDRAVQYLVSGH